MRAMALVTALGLALAGCGISPDYVEQSEADVLLLINTLNGGNVLQSDVREGTNSTTVVADVVPVGIANRSKNPAVTSVQVARAIQLERYTVRYFRSDGRNTEGVDVPYAISGELRTVVDVGGNITVNIDPPLTNLRGIAPTALGGSSLIITCFAEVTIYGTTTSGKAVADSGRMQIDFADTGD
jgi:hypothetical protein